MDLEIVKFIQRASSEFLDGLFSIITVLGETSMFFMMFVAIYLCYRKEFAIKYLFFFMFTGVANGTIKSAVARPRPYTNPGVLDIKHTTGYSFPSGHSNSIATQSTMIGMEYFREYKGHRGRVILLSALALVCVMVAFSRIYLGQHYLTDVLAGLSMGLVLVLGLEVIYNFIYNKIKGKFSTRAFLLVMIVPVLIMLVCVEYFNLGSASMLNTFYTYVAIYVGVLVGYNIDKSFVGYKENNVWYIQFIKIAIACVGIASLSLAFDWIENDVVRNFSLYLSATLYVTAILPVLFKYLFRKSDDKVKEET